MYSCIASLFLSFYVSTPQNKPVKRLPLESLTAAESEVAEEGVDLEACSQATTKLTINLNICHKKVAAFFPEISLLSSLMQTILPLQIVMASMRKLMHNLPGLRASTAACCVAERNKNEWIPFTGKTETRPPKMTSLFITFYI